MHVEGGTAAGVAADGTLSDDVLLQEASFLILVVLGLQTRLKAGVGAEVGAVVAAAGGALGGLQGGLLGEGEEKGAGEDFRDLTGESLRYLRGRVRGVRLLALVGRSWGVVGDGVVRSRGRLRGLRCVLAPLVPWDLVLEALLGAFSAFWTRSAAARISGSARASARVRETAHCELSDAGAACVHTVRFSLVLGDALSPRVGDGDPRRGPRGSVSLFSLPEGSETSSCACSFGFATSSTAAAAACRALLLLLLSSRLLLLLRAPPNSSLRSSSFKRSSSVGSDRASICAGSEVLGTSNSGMSSPKAKIAQSSPD